MKSQKLIFLTIFLVLLILNCFPVICIASSPGVLKLDVDVIDIKLGMQDQPGGAIILNESMAGAIRRAPALHPAEARKFSGVTMPMPVRYNLEKYTESTFKALLTHTTREIGTLNRQQPT